MILHPARRRNRRLKRRLELVAAHERLILVTGDSHLLDLAGRAPVLSPAEFLSRLD